MTAKPSLTDTARADMVALGLSPQQIAAMGLEDEGDDAEPCIEVEPGNAMAVRIFQRAQSQWRTAVSGQGVVKTGLDYNVLPVIARALRTKLDDDALGRIQIMEFETIRLRAKRKVR